MLALTAALLVGYMVIGVFGQSDQIKIILPEKKLDLSTEVPLVVGQLVPPPVDNKWEQVDDINKKAQQAKSAIAYLEQDDKVFQTPLVCFLNTNPQFPADEKSYAIISAVKYEEGNNSTMVTLSEASPATCRTGAVFGSSTISLDNGEKAFLWENTKLQYPRSIALVRGNKVITIATTANQEELIKMANKIVQVEGDNSI